jgi:hypothetical protein
MFKEKSIQFEEFSRLFSEIFADTNTTSDIYYDSEKSYAFIFNVDLLTSKSLKMIQDFALSLKLTLELTSVVDSKNQAFIHVRFIQY